MEKKQYVSPSMKACTVCAERRLLTESDPNIQQGGDKGGKWSADAKEEEMDFGW